MPSEASALVSTLGIERIADHIRPVGFGVRLEALLAAIAHLLHPPVCFSPAFCIICSISLYKEDKNMCSYWNLEMYQLHICGEKKK